MISTEREVSGGASAAQAGPSKDLWSGELMTRTGFTFSVRPALPGDEDLLAEFFTHVTPEDLRFRFLTALPKVDRERLMLLTHSDHSPSENFLAFDLGGTAVIATAMLAAQPNTHTAEVAMSLHQDYKGRGLAWTLLEHVGRYAEASGIRTMESIESRDNYAAIELEREMGFTAHACVGDPSSVIIRRTLGNTR